MSKPKVKIILVTFFEINGGIMVLGALLCPTVNQQYGVEDLDKLKEQVR